MTMQIRRTRTPDLAPTDLVPGQLGVEMASHPAKLWIGVPNAIDPARRRLLIGAGSTGGGGGGFSTGDVKLSLRSTPDDGWLMCNDSTFGDVGSGASTNDPSCEALFKLLFANVADSLAPILTSAGAATTRAAQGSADDAWNNKVRMTLPRMLGRVLALAGQGAGLSAQALGGHGGAEATALGSNQIATHRHPPWTGYFADHSYSNPFIWAAQGPNHLISLHGQTHASGDGGVHSNLQPTTYFHAMICL